MERIRQEFAVTTNDEKWNNIFSSKPDEPSIIDLKRLKNDIIQISRNRWAEGIYDIELIEITSNKVAINIEDLSLIHI